MILMIIIFIFAVIGLIGSIFSTKEYFYHINHNWKTLKQVNDEYMGCLLWGWMSLMGTAVCGLYVLGFIIGFIFYIC